MLFKNSRLWFQHTPFIAARDSALISLAAFVVRYAIHDWIEPYAVFHFFMVACVLIAIRYGYKSALSCLVASYFLGNYFFIEPYGRFGEVTTTDFIQGLNFFFVTAIAIGVIEKLQRTIYSQRLSIKVMQDRQRSMLYRQNELIQKLKSLGNLK